MNPFRDVNWDPGPAEKRKFAVSLMIGFPALATFFSILTWLAHAQWKPFLLWLGAAGFGLGLILWLLPVIAKPFYVVWYFVACCVGIVLGNVLLAVLYYLVVTPIGLLLRGIGKLSFQKRIDKTAPTYWRDREKTVDFARYYRQY